MSRIDETMSALAAKKRKALVAYVCMGDPSYQASIDVAVACAEAGADVLEIGVPFSDPTADGPIIARASERALQAGGGLVRSIDAARAIRARTAAPLLLFGYYNPIFVHGEERTVQQAKDAGIDGLLVVDLPVEEAAPLRAICKRHGMSLVPLLTPTSGPERVALTKAAIAGGAGFVYYVSVAGVTGSGQAPLELASARAAELRRETGAPVVVGFGIDSPEKARVAAAGADGVVVGSAIVRAGESSMRSPQGSSATADVTRLIRGLRAALDEA